MGGAAQAVGRTRRKLAEATGHEGRRRDHCCRLRVSKWIESRSKPLSSDPRAGRESLGAVAAAGLSWGDVEAPLRASCWEAEMWNNDTLNWEGLLRLRSVAGSSIKCSREACPGELTYRQAGLCGHTLQRPSKLPSWQPKGDSRTKGAKGENRTLTIEWETCPHRPQPGVFRPPGVSWPFTICVQQKALCSFHIGWRQGCRGTGSSAGWGAFLVRRLKLSHQELGEGATVGLGGSRCGPATHQALPGLSSLECWDNWNGAESPRGQ